MSKKTITFGQSIPFYGKRDSKEQISLRNDELLNVKLTQAKVNLVYEIKNQAYRVWELQELLKIISQYETLTKQNIGLSESYTSTSDNQHMGIMSAQLSLTDLRIQKSTLKAKRFMALSRLSYLASYELKELSIELSVDELKTIETLRESLRNNPRIVLKEKEIKKSMAMLNAAELDNYPDINFVGAYSFRENFDNYFSFGVGVMLPIYASEDYKEEKQRKLLLSSKSLKEDTKIAVDSQFLNAYAQMKSAHEIYHIVHDEALPQIQHMFELTNASISTGGDMFKYIDILKQKLKLEKQSINAVTLFNTSYAKISALRGELK